jgi:hypothetical protein
MEISVLDEAKNLGNVGKKLFNLDEQLEVSSLQEQMKNYLDKNEKTVTNKESTKEKNVQTPAQTVIEIRQEKVDVKKEKNKFLNGVVGFVGEIAKNILMSKLVGKTGIYLQPVIKNLKEKVLNFKQRFTKA